MYLVVCTVAVPTALPKPPRSVNSVAGFSLVAQTAQHTREQQHSGMPNILGLMVTRGSRWVIRSFLSRHAPMFELLAVLDGSPPGSSDASWTAVQCKMYSNVIYSLERDVNITTPPTDQTARAAATRLLLRGLGGDETHLHGRWIFLAHADEFYVQDVRDVVARVALRDPLASIILFDILYAMPTPEERQAIATQHDAFMPQSRSVTNAKGHSFYYQAFDPIQHLQHCDAEFPFREPRPIYLSLSSPLTHASATQTLTQDSHDTLGGTSGRLVPAKRAAGDLAGLCQHQSS